MRREDAFAHTLSVNIFQAMEAYGVPGFATLAELLASDVVFEGVWICTRTDTHVPIILEVCPAGMPCVHVRACIHCTQASIRANALAFIFLSCARVVHVRGLEGCLSLAPIISVSLHVSILDLKKKKRRPLQASTVPLRNR
jgi:hypothetical protein